MFPAFLKLDSRRVLVVGGGRVAAGKAKALVEAGAVVVVVSPAMSPEIEQLGVTLVRRGFQESDLDGAWWVVAAAPGDVNRQVAAAAESRHVFVNAVDDPENATSYAGGVVRRDGVTFAISTDGRAPALAGLLREALDAWLPNDLEEWLETADEARREWKTQAVPMERRRPQLLEKLNELYAARNAGSAAATSAGRLFDKGASEAGRSAGAARGRVSLVGAGPGDAKLWTLRAAQLLEEADLVLYDALVDVNALRRATTGQCFCVGKRARRDSVPQETINRLMIRAAKQGKHVVRLKGGDPFVFGRGGEEALAVVRAGIPLEVVPGVTTAVAAPELAGIPVTHRGMSSAFLVLAGHTSDTVDATLRSVRPHSMSIVILMGVGARRDLAARLMSHGWSGDVAAAIVCSASTPDAWTWTGRLDEMGAAAVPSEAAGVLVVGEVVGMRHVLHSETLRASEIAAVKAEGTPEGGVEDEVIYGRNR